jgi:hypothetical protein
MIANIRDQFFEILDQEEVEDVIDLNEKFLCMALGGIEVSELAMLPKIELRVDTSSHNLQVTGEILTSLEYLKLNDSIIRSFRDIGTSFKNVRVLHIARCELKEVQGIQAFEQLEELYISYNEIDDLFDISFLEHLSVLDLEGNNVQAMSQLMYLKRCKNLTEVNFKHNPVSQGQNAALYCEKVLENAPRLAILDDEVVCDDRQEFLEFKRKQCKHTWQQQLAMKTSSASASADPILSKFLRLGMKKEVVR